MLSSPSSMRRNNKSCPTPISPSSDNVPSCISPNNGSCTSASEQLQNYIDMQQCIGLKMDPSELDGTQKLPLQQTNYASRQLSPLSRLIARRKKNHWRMHSQQLKDEYSDDDEDDDMFHDSLRSKALPNEGTALEASLNRRARIHRLFSLNSLLPSSTKIPQPKSQPLPPPPPTTLFNSSVPLSASKSFNHSSSSLDNDENDDCSSFSSSSSCVSSHSENFIERVKPVLRLNDISDEDCYARPKIPTAHPKPQMPPLPVKNHNITIPTTNATNGDGITTTNSDSAVVQENLCKKIDDQAQVLQQLLSLAEKKEESVLCKPEEGTIILDHQEQQQPPLVAAVPPAISKEQEHCATKHETLSTTGTQTEENDDKDNSDSHELLSYFNKKLSKDISDNSSSIAEQSQVIPLTVPEESKTDDGNDIKDDEKNMFATLKRLCDILEERLPEQKRIDEKMIEPPEPSLNAITECFDEEQPVESITVAAEMVQEVLVESIVEPVIETAASQDCIAPQIRVKKEVSPVKESPVLPSSPPPVLIEVISENLFDSEELSRPSSSSSSSAAQEEELSTNVDIPMLELEDDCDDASSSSSSNKDGANSITSEKSDALQHSNSSSSTTNNNPSEKFDSVGHAVGLHSLIEQILSTNLEENSNTSFDEIQDRSSSTKEEMLSEKDYVPPDFKSMKEQYSCEIVSEINDRVVASRRNSLTKTSSSSSSSIYKKLFPAATLSDRDDLSELKALLP